MGAILVRLYTELQVVQAWSSAVRSKLTALDMVCYVEFEDVKNIVEQLPNLRWLGWKAMHGWPDYNGAIYPWTWIPLPSSQISKRCTSP